MLLLQHICPKCGATSPLHLSFAYGLDAAGAECIVVDAFLPSSPLKWQDSAGRDVTFYPFLIITEGEDGRGAWLPYWHVVRGHDGESKKYGQWAPSMSLSTLDELITKARSKGWLSQ
jgi:hypothetical protein